MKLSQVNRPVDNFELRAVSALGISIIADGLDYIGSPIFAMPIIGDIADLIVAGLLYRITKSKITVVLNAVEFIPFIGDFIPTYTISTLLWVLNESRRRRRYVEPSNDKGTEKTTRFHRAVRLASNTLSRLTLPNKHSERSVAK